MRQVSFNLPIDENVQKRLPPGTYRVTVVGLSDNNDTVTVEARNAANNGWDAAVSFNRSDSGRIGSKTVTVNANGILRCQLNNEIQPTEVKVFVSA